MGGLFGGGGDQGGISNILKMLAMGG